jgi:hypothetical protein
MWKTRRTQGALDAPEGALVALVVCAPASAPNKPPSITDRLAGILCSMETLAVHLGSRAALVKFMNCMLHITAIECGHVGQI